MVFFRDSKCEVISLTWMQYHHNGSVCMVWSILWCSMKEMLEKKISRMPFNKGRLGDVLWEVFGVRDL